MSWVRYGPATEEVRVVLARYIADREGTCARVAAWSPRHRVEERSRRLKLPRDYAWTRFHHGIDAHGVTPAFRLLWQDLVPPNGGPDWFDIADAACATLLKPYLNIGPFTRADFDTLMAPWRAGMHHCPRSRLYLQVATHPPFEQNFWPAVDAALARIASV